MPARLVFTLVLAAGLLSGNSPARARRAPPPPRTPAHLLQVMADSPHGGECASCHTLHGSDLPTPQEHALTGPDDNTFCDHCHTTPWAGGSYAGTRSYDSSAHGSGSATIWPGERVLLRGGQVGTVERVATRALAAVRAVGHDL